MALRYMHGNEEAQRTAIAAREKQMACKLEVTIQPAEESSTDES